MKTNSAIQLAMLGGAMIFGAVFVSIVGRSGVLMGVLSSGLIGVVSGILLLGVLSALIPKGAANLPATSAGQSNEDAVLSIFVPTLVAMGSTAVEARAVVSRIYNEARDELLVRTPDGNPFRADQGSVLVGRADFMAPVWPQALPIKMSNFFGIVRRSLLCAKRR